MNRYLKWHLQEIDCLLSMQQCIAVGAYGMPVEEVDEDQAPWRTSLRDIQAWPVMEHATFRESENVQQMKALLLCIVWDASFLLLCVVGSRMTECPGYVDEAWTHPREHVVAVWLTSCSLCV